MSESKDRYFKRWSVSILLVSNTVIMIFTDHSFTATILQNNEFYKKKKRDGYLQTSYSRGDNIKINF